MTRQKEQGRPGSPYLDQVRLWVSGLLEQFSNELSSNAETGDDRLDRAIQYALLGEGKRLRPALILATVQTLMLRESADAKAASIELAGNPHECKLIQASERSFEITAAINACAFAVEAIHTYSLVHDDLPAMDDDDLRRGRATCHKQFDEAEAILAGDALQAQAFQTLLQADIGCELGNALGLLLAKSAGRGGMVLGQSLDMQAEQLTNHAESDQAALLARLIRIHQLKTGALFGFCFGAAGLICKVEQGLLTKLTDLGLKLGQYFQIQDDILDATRSAKELGKSASDAEAGKLTYISVLGAEQAKHECHTLGADIDGVFKSLCPYPNPLVELMGTIKGRRK